MALNRLSIAEMVKHSGDLVQAGSPERAAIEAIPEAAALLPQLQRAHEGLIAAQPPNDSEIAEITEELGLLDATHDDLLRAIDGRLASELELAGDEAARDALTRARTVLLPDGLSIVQRSYTEQAGEGALRAARVDPEVKAVLGRLSTYDGRTLDAIYERLQAVAAEIGALVKRRAELGEQGRRVADAREARLRWIRTVNALATVLAMLGVDEGPILGRIRETEREAERGGQPAAPAPAPAPDGPPAPDDDARVTDPPADPPAADDPAPDPDVPS